MVESVAWMSEQKNTLSAVFYLTAMRIYLEFDDSRRSGQYMLSFGLFVLGSFGQDRNSNFAGCAIGHLLVEAWPSIVAARCLAACAVLPFGAVAGFATAWVERTLIGAEGVDFELTFLQRGLLAGRAIWFYLSKLLWPIDLVFIYPRWQIDTRVWWQWLFPLAALAATVLLWRLRRRSRHHWPPGSCSSARCSLPRDFSTSTRSSFPLWPITSNTLQAWQFSCWPRPEPPGF